MYACLAGSNRLNLLMLKGRCSAEIEQKHAQADGRQHTCSQATTRRAGQPLLPNWHRMLYVKLEAQYCIELHFASVMWNLAAHITASAAAVPGHQQPYLVTHVLASTTEPKHTKHWPQTSAAATRFTAAAAASSIISA
jgi:hypothetical protein